MRMDGTSPPLPRDCHGAPTPLPYVSQGPGESGAVGCLPHVSVQLGEGSLKKEGVPQLGWEGGAQLAAGSPRPALMHAIMSRVHRVEVANLATHRSAARLPFRLTTGATARRAP